VVVTVRPAFSHAKEPAGRPAQVPEAKALRGLPDQPVGQPVAAGRVKSTVDIASRTDEWRAAGWL